MPLYDFRCDACETPFERLVRRRDESVACPDCGSATVERLMSAPVARVDGRSPDLPIAGGCPPVEAGPCGTGCCRLPG